MVTWGKDRRPFHGGEYPYETLTTVFLPEGQTLTSAQEVAVTTRGMQLLGDLELQRRIARLPSLQTHYTEADGTYYEYGFIMGVPFVRVWPRAGVSAATTPRIIRGLAYAASVPDSVGEFGEHFRYPYDGTPNNYGTRQSYLWSAVPTYVLTPDGKPVKQTVARVAKRTDGSYADSVRGVLEGGWIQQHQHQAYWVRERSGGVFKDTDEVWTTAGDIVWCNGKAVAAYFPDAGDGFRYGAVAFPFGGKVVLVSEGGIAATIPISSSPLNSAQPGLNVFVGTISGNYHPKTDQASSETRIISAPGWLAQIAVDQGGTKFALYDGKGRAKAYSLSVAGSDVVASNTHDIDDSYTTTSADPYYTTTETVAAPAPSNPFDPTKWPANVQLSRVYQNGNPPFDALATNMLKTLAPVKYEGLKTLTRVYTEGQDEMHTAAFAFVDDVAMPILCHTVSSVSGGLVTSYRQELWGQPIDENITYPPFGYNYVGASAWTPVNDVVPEDWYWKYTGPDRSAVSWDIKQSGSGFSSSLVSSISTFHGAVKTRELSAEFPTYEYSYSALNYEPITVGTRAIAGVTINDYTQDAGVDEYAESFDVVGLVKSVTRDILLLDPHNEVLAYVERGSETAYEAHLVGSSYRPLIGNDEGIPTGWNEFPAEQRSWVRVVVVFGGSEFDLVDEETTSFVATYNDIRWAFAYSTYMGGGTISSDNSVLFPVIQGMCPYIAYRRPNTDSAEMIFSHSDTGQTTDHLNSTFTEEGIEDWLTSCGVPAAVTSRVATCFRVGGPRLPNEV